MYHKIIVMALILSVQSEAKTLIYASDIESSYKALNKSLENFLGILKKNKDAQAEVSEIIKISVTNQKNNEATMSSAADATTKLEGQSSAFLKAEILRGETAQIKNKEMIRLLSRRLYSISKEEIKTK